MKRIRTRASLAAALFLVAACETGGGPGGTAADPGPDLPAPGGDTAAEPGTGADPATLDEPGAGPEPGQEPDSGADPAAEAPGSDLPPGDPPAGQDPSPDPATPDEAAAEVGPPDPGSADAAAEAEVPPVGPAAPDGVGPFAVVTSTTKIQRGSRSIPVVARVPTRPDGKASPLVVFAPGFQLDANAYAGTLERIASHGFVTVGATPPGSMFSISHVEMAADLSAAIDWALDGAGPLAGKADGTRVCAAGHSLGGKLAVMLAADDARVRAVFGIDPVNGGNPLTGYSTDLPDVVPETVATLAIPLGFAGETTDSTGSLFGQACAPADQNYGTFFDAAGAATWAARWDFANANHMSFLDNPNCGMACSVCKAAPGDPKGVLAGIRTLAVAFLRRHFEGDLAMDAWLSGASVPAGVTATVVP